MALGKSGGMLPRKIVENLDAEMVFLVLLENFFSEVLFNFLPLTLSPSPNI